MIRRKATAALGAMHRNAIACLALFVAIGGTSYAAATIGPGDIRTDAVRTRHIAEGHVVSNDIRKDTVRSQDINNDSIRRQDIGTEQVDAGEIATGAVRRDEIPTAAVGTNEIADGSVRGADVSEEVPSGLVLVRNRSVTFDPDDKSVSTAAECPEFAPSVIGGGGFISGGGLDGEHMIISNGPTDLGPVEGWRVTAVESTRGDHPSGLGVFARAICARADIPVFDGQ